MQNLSFSCEKCEMFFTHEIEYEKYWLSKYSDENSYMNGYLHGLLDSKLSSMNFVLRMHPKIDTKQN
jgi:hypothetical protein